MSAHITKQPSVYYSAYEVAALIGISLRTVRSLDAQRKLPGRKKIGRLVKFSKAAIHKWLSTEDSK
jgi:excisionase family DNA binding protein